jgi:hypothetical protein
MVDREDDEISVAPGSQERVFLDEEESNHPTDSQRVKRVPSSGSTNSHQTVVDGSPVPETDNTSLPSLMICKAANTWLDSGKELYVDELSRIKPQEA